MHKAESMGKVKGGVSTAHFAPGHRQFTLLTFTWDTTHRASLTRDTHPSRRVQNVHCGAITQAQLTD